MSVVVLIEIISIYTFYYININVGGEIYINLKLSYISIVLIFCVIYILFSYFMNIFLISLIY